VDTSGYPSVTRVYFTLQWSGIKLVRPLSTVDNTLDYARVSHSRQWSNYNITFNEVDYDIMAIGDNNNNNPVSAAIGGFTTGKYGLLP